MSCSLRVTEQPSGAWACRFGLTKFDEHDDLAEAVGHIRLLAQDRQPASIYLHRRDGSVHRVEDIP